MIVPFRPKARHHKRRLFQPAFVDALLRTMRSGARLAVQTHLARIALHRPLDQITDPTERAAAERVRTWFEKELLNVLMD